MNRLMQRGTAFFTVTAGLACLTSSAFAQSLIVTNGTTVAYTGDTVPDTTGVDLPGYLWGGTGGFDSCGMDDSGNLFFRAQMQEASLTPINDRAYFYGSTRANLKMLIQGGDQAPSLAPGVLLRTALGTSSGLSGTIRFSPAGHTWWGSNTYDGTTSGQSLFGGLPGSLALIQAQGDAAPGTVGATFAQAFNSLSQQNSGINRNGVIYFNATITGGDVVGTTNRIGLWTGLPGGLTLVQRMGSPMNGVPGTEVVNTGTPFGFTTEINDANQLFYEAALSQTAGATPALVSNDRVYMMYTPSTSTYTVIVREGDAAPGTFGGAGPSFATFNALTGDAWTISQSSNCWTRSAKTFFFTELRGGDVVTGVNDRAGYVYSGGALTMAMRKGDAAPGTDAFFASWNGSSMGMNDAGQVMVQGALTGGTSTTANDTGIWAGFPGSLQLVVREGQTMPGTGGSIASGFSGTSCAFNDQGRVAFTTTLSGGTVTGGSWWIWDPVTGLKPLILANDIVEVETGVFKTLTGALSLNTANNGDGAAMFFGHNGKLAVRATIAAGSGGGSAIIRIDVPPNSPTTAFCFGDGTGTACPCGNSGAVGNGCANSLNPSGGNLVGSGVMSIANDSFVLTGSGVPNGPGLYFQADNQLGAGLGVVFGDGLRCAGGNVFRLGIVVAAANTSSYPNGIAPNNVPISVKGFCAAGNTRQYQLWYRDSDATFCTAAVFNLTNGLTGVWTP